MSTNLARAFAQRHGRAGYASTIAMLFLMLFVTLSIAFYANVGTAVQSSYNDVSTARARFAAESGMEFIRYQLAVIDIPHYTAPENLFTEVYNDLADAMNDTANLSGGSIALVGNEIRIPGNTSAWIPADNDGGEFRATITKVGQRLRVNVTGRRGSATELARALQLEYAVAQKASSIFDFGVASKSAIALNGNVKIRGTAGNEGNGSVLSTTLTNPTPLTMIGSCEISGDVSFVNPDPSSIAVSNQSTIAGFKPSSAEFEKHVHAGVAPPDFPVIDTAVYAPYAVNNITTSNPAGTTFKNIRIKAGANPKFASNTVIQGVCYIEYPNQVEFSGGAQIQGVVVVHTNSTGNEDLNPTNNTIKFAGNVTATPLSSLPATADFPESLRSLSGAMLLAPGFTATFRGNFGSVSGSIIASKLEFSGTAGGTVKGSVINLQDTALTLAGTSDIVIESQGTTDYPDGVFFGSNYAPLPDTYLEVLP